MKKNWRWWFALVPVVGILITLHAFAALGERLSCACEWLEFRCWRLHLWFRNAANRFAKACHAWVFKRSATL